MVIPLLNAKGFLLDLLSLCLGSGFPRAAGAALEAQILYGELQGRASALSSLGQWDLEEGLCGYFTNLPRARLNSQCIGKKCIFHIRIFLVGKPASKSCKP